MEYWDLYDRDRNLLPGTMLRGEPQPAGTYHLVVHLCIFNSDGEMLIQHRQKHKRGWPDRWDFSPAAVPSKGTIPTLRSLVRPPKNLGTTTIFPTRVRR